MCECLAEQSKLISEPKTVMLLGGCYKSLLPVAFNSRSRLCKDWRSSTVTQLPFILCNYGSQMAHQLRVFLFFVLFCCFFLGGGGEGGIVFFLSNRKSQPLAHCTCLSYLDLFYFIYLFLILKNNVP